MPVIEFGVEGILKLLREINPKKAGGPDNVPARFLKEAAEELASSIYRHLFQQSYDSGQLPST